MTHLVHSSDIDMTATCATTVTAHAYSGVLEITLKPAFLYSAFQKTMDRAGAMMRSMEDAITG